MDEKLDIAVVETKNLSLEERVELLENVVKGMATAIVFLWNAAGGDVSPVQTTAGPES